MKTHTTDYSDTFIAVAEDCPVSSGKIPPQKGDSKTIAAIQFQLISKNAYTFTSDDILFQVFADRNDLIKSEYKEAREKYFSKGQPCLRCSPLGKKYGWGMHFNSDGKVALFGMETKQYQDFLKDTHLNIVKAMRSSKK